MIVPAKKSQRCRTCWRRNPLLRWCLRQTLIQLRLSAATHPLNFAPCGCPLSGRKSRPTSRIILPAEPPPTDQIRPFKPPHHTCLTICLEQILTRAYRQTKFCTTTDSFATHSRRSHCHRPSCSFLASAALLPTVSREQFYKKNSTPFTSLVPIFPLTDITIHRSKNT